LPSELAGRSRVSCGPRVVWAIQQDKAAARIALIGTILTEHSRVRLRCIGGKGRRSAAVVEVAGE